MTTAWWWLGGFLLLAHSFYVVYFSSSTSKFCLCTIYFLCLLLSVLHLHLSLHWNIKNVIFSLCSEWSSVFFIIILSDQFTVFNMLFNCFRLLGTNFGNKYKFTFVAQFSCQWRNCLLVLMNSLLALILTYKIVMTCQVIFLIGLLWFLKIVCTCLSLISNAVRYKSVFWKKIVQLY